MTTLHPRGTRRRIVKAACPHDCPDTCAMEITVEDGRAVEVRGGDLPFTHGTLCTKVSKYLERVYAPDRVLHPLRRLGTKGPGARYERISWDAALDLIATRFAALAAEDAQQILPYSYAGTMGMVQYSSMDRRFFHRLGASLLERTICSSAGKAGLKLVLGGSVGMDPERFDEAKLILIWGSNPIVSNLHCWSRMQEAKRRGAKLVIIDPWHNDTARKCHQHLAIMPGTDAALALAMMHVIIGEQLHDRDYVARHTHGFHELRQHVQQYPPQWAAGVCGLGVHEIATLAREYATEKPAAIRLNYGLQRCAGGAAAVRAVACLPALVGAWRDAGGGVVLSTSDHYRFDHVALERPDLVRGKPRAINMSAIGNALLEARPPIKAIYVYNSNPVAVAPEARKVVAGFARADLFCVVHDVFLTDTADYADVVLPATTQLEHHDVHKSYGHLYVLANNPAIAPEGEAKPNSEVFRLLAQRLGFDETCLRDSDEEICRTALGTQEMDWEALKETGWQRLHVPARFAPFAEGGFPTPSGKCELASDAAVLASASRLPEYVPPHEAASSNPELARRYPLAFISPPARNFLNSSFANLPFARATDKEPYIDIHVDDAQVRGIREGDWVSIHNDRGAFRARARVGLKARPRVVVAPSVWWRKLSPDGENANAVTSQALTDLGAGATFYDCLVEVTRVADAQADASASASTGGGRRNPSPAIRLDKD
jgi:anaerobic selenocysteine-containing dehydrogenase